MFENFYKKNEVLFRTYARVTYVDNDDKQEDADVDIIDKSSHFYLTVLLRYDS